MMSSQLDDAADEFPVNPFLTDSTPPAFAQQPSQNMNQSSTMQQQQVQPPPLQQPSFQQPPQFSSPSPLQQQQQGFNSGFQASSLSGPMNNSMASMDNNGNNGNSGNTGGVRLPVPQCCSFETYANYFNVDTEDIKTRIVGAIKFANIPDYFRNNILNQEGKGPDLYGPIWITMTLIFFLAVTSNASKYLHSNHAANFEYDISHLVHAMWVLNCFVFVLPCVNYLLFKCVGVTSVSVIELISLYGYSMVIFFPTTLLCLIPVEALEWIFLLAGTCISVLLILRNVARPVLESSQQQRAGPMLIFIMVAHLIFFLVLKFTFYYHPHQKGNQSSSTQNDAKGVSPTSTPTIFSDGDDGDNSGDQYYPNRY